MDPDVKNALANDDIHIPVKVQPFLKKQIDDQVFKDLLYDEVDMERVSLNLKQFKEIHFGTVGFPLIMIMWWSFISREPVEMIL